MKTKSKRADQIPVHFFNHLQNKIDLINRKGGDVIRLDIGSPDLPPPDHVISSLIESVRSPHSHGYQSHRGTDNLRIAWSQYYLDNFGVTLDPDKNILPLLGTKEGIFHLPKVCIDRGDLVLIPDPGYVTYTRGTTVAGGVPRYFSLHQQNNYLPDLSEIEAKDVQRARLLWLNYPNNPTGAIATLESFETALRFAEENDLIVCHDAAYSQIIYNGVPAPSIMQVPGAEKFCVEFNSLSKSHNMAGWRVGVMVGNQQVVNNLYSLKTNVDSGHFRPILDATVSALLGDQTWIKVRNEIYRSRRDCLMDGLERIGLNVFRTTATLYVWFQIPDGWSSEAFTMAVLENAWVSMTPGTVFGKNGEGYVRLSITVNEEKIREAINRLQNWFAKGEVI